MCTDHHKTNNLEDHRALLKVVELHPREKPMTDPYSPKAIWGRELRHYRESAGYTQSQLAALINFAPSLISGIENGHVPAVPEFAEACDEVLNTGGALTRGLDYRKSKTERYPPWFGEWPIIETKSTMLRNFELAVIPGLLQTPAYASALLNGDEEAVAGRLERQQVLSREEPPPPKLRCVVDEGALHRPVGDAKVMQEQLLHITERAVTSALISVQVLPYGVHTGLPGSFWIASLRGGKGEVAYVETALRGLITRTFEDLEHLTDVWESIRTDSLPERDSLDLIRRTAEERWT
ncbi:helix-turn-helix domain-containing protein [Actinomadura rudentiformis]|uniref:Helix-turn-helix domain-containing protein n=1 Tax=Actinomadura rudentiformis TaxID=359158 RepID=A0A6H9Z2L8_9ACTN|nr:helix-turn-helix transcriptional regulator [Actinomadura rudentiformis]KAB2348516.1 helix-turn-helix domain-containing protein [Actinomadura rudentiformis]